MQPHEPQVRGAENGLPPPEHPERDIIYRTPEGLPLRWRSLEGAVHAAEGAQTVREDPRTFLMWTRCGLHDVPPEAAWAGDDELSCELCAEIESGTDD